MEPTVRHGRGVVKSLDRALEVLTCFSTDRVEWGITEIAEHLGVAKSAAHRFLSTFENAGFVERTPSRRYRLAVRVLELANVYRFQQRFLWTAHQPMDRLAQELSAMVHLAQLHGRDVLELARVTARPEPEKVPSLRMPAHCTALGKVLLAFGGTDVIESFIGHRVRFKRMTAYTITNAAELREHLRQVVRQGYAMDDQECTLGQRCLGVPVRDETGKMIASLSLSSSVTSLNDSNVAPVLSRMTAAAKVISQGLVQTSVRTPSGFPAMDPGLPRARRDPRSAESLGTRAF